MLFLSSQPLMYFNSYFFSSLDKKMNTFPLILMNIFRPVTITSPDILTIIEVHLIMCDFEQPGVILLYY